jgi:transposase
MRHVLGIDIAKRKVDVALSADNQRFAQATFANECAGHQALQEWLVTQGVQRLHVCLEATGRYGDALAHFLHEQGYGVSVVNPLRLHGYGQSKLRRNKQDALDARWLADFCFTQQPEPWTPPAAAQRELQELTRELSSLKSDRQRKHNKLTSGLTSPQTHSSLDRQLAFLDQEIERLEQAIHDHIDHDPQLSADHDLLTSIPGIGPLTAAHFLAEVDVTRFQHAPQVAAYAGLVPREYSSGTSVHKQPRLSKIGNPHLRRAFYMPALAAQRFNPLVKALVARLTERGKGKMVIVGAVMRKLIHLAFGVLKTRKPFDPLHLQNIPVGG